MSLTTAIITPFVNLMSMLNVINAFVRQVKNNLLNFPKIYTNFLKDMMEMELIALSWKQIVLMRIFAMFMLNVVIMQHLEEARACVL